MQLATPLSQTTPQTEAVKSQQTQGAPLPLDLDALRHVVGGGPGGSWGDTTP